MAAKTLTVRGHKIRTTTMRRLVLIAVRENDVPERRLVGVTGGEPVYEETGHVYARFAEILKRSDNYARLSLERSRIQRRGGTYPGTALVVVDTETGEEI